MVSAQVTEYTKTEILLLNLSILNMKLKQAILDYEKRKKPVNLEILQLRCWLVGLTLYTILSTFLIAFNI